MCARSVYIDEDKSIVMLLDWYWGELTIIEIGFYCVGYLLVTHGFRFGCTDDKIV